MPSTCVVPFCSSKTGGHKFPRDRTLREKWIAAIRRINFVPSEYSIVCKKHFKKDDFRMPKYSTLNNPVPVLKKDSIPSKFSWNEHNSTQKKKNDKSIIISPRCSVLQCRPGSTKNILLHSCPNQESVRKKWAEVFKVNRDVVKNMLICSQHFLKTDYLCSKNGESRTLKQNAVPSQKLPRSTRVICVRKKHVQSKKKITSPKNNVKREEKMTEAEVKSSNLDQDKESRECRACLKKMEAKTSVCNIFQSWSPPWFGMEATIAEDLAKIAHVEISEADQHSKVICEPCYHKLLAASTFAAKVLMSDKILKERVKLELDKVWPKPIQVDKNINGNILHEMDVEIKQEILSDDEYNPVPTDSTYGPENAYLEPDMGNMEIKIEPEEYVEPPPLTITINGTMSLNPKVNPEHKTLLNGDNDDYEAIISENLEITVPLTNGTEDINNEQFIGATIKEEPRSDEDDHEQILDMPLECLLCTKSFNSVTGLKAHVIAQHSYKSVKRKAGGGESPEKKQRDEHRCQICKRSFLTSTDLMVHETCHNKHSCYGCSRKFDTFKQLSKHRKRCRAPRNKTVVKVKTLDDVKRPLKEEKMDTSDADTLDTNHEDSNDSSMKLNSEAFSTKSETHSIKSETHSVKSETETLDGNDLHIETLDENYT